MTVTVSEKAKALMLMQVRLDEANARVKLELEQHLFQLNMLREAIIARDSVEKTMGLLVRAIATER